MVEMTPAEAAAFLRRYNEWRRTDDRYGMPYPDPREIGEAIDAAVEMIERLEAAEKERDNANAASVNIALEAERLQCENDALRAALRHEADCMEAAMAEIKSLRAKIEAMEQPESGFRERCTPAAPAGGSNRFPLYALPGAQSKPARGEAGHDEGRCGNVQCLPGAHTKGEKK